MKNVADSMRSVDPRLWGHDSVTDRTDEIDVFAETEVAPSDDVAVAKAISDASMLAVAPQLTPPITIPPPPTLPKDLGAVIEEEDAYFHPGGEIRSIVPPTPNEGIRVAANAEQLRARARRSWVFTMVVAIALPVVLVAVIVAIGRTTTLGDDSRAQVAAAAPRTIHVAADSRTPLASPIGLRATLKASSSSTKRPSSPAGRPAFGRTRK